MNQEDFDKWFDDNWDKEDCNVGNKFLIKPKNLRKVRVLNCCLNCKYNVLEEAERFRVCERSGQSEWGEPEDMVDYVCDGHVRTESFDR